MTLENGITMDIDTLQYLEMKLDNIQSIKTFISHYKRKYSKGNTINKSIIDEILSNSDGVNYSVENIKYKYITLREKYEYFKGNVNQSFIEISALENNVFCNIFGLFYVAPDGNYILEDSRDSIKLSFENFEDNLFLYENMCVGFEGRLQEDQFFSVTKAILPFRNNTYKYSGKEKILVFSEFRNQEDLVYKAIKKHNADIIMVSVEDINKKYSWPVSAVVCSSRSSIFNLPSSKNTNLFSNPNVMHLSSGLSIGFIDHNLFKYKENGHFYNSKPLESFYESYISQQSLNPFIYNNFLEKHLNFIVVAQDTPPFIMEINNTHLISAPSLNDKGYVVIDTKTMNCEICYE